MEYDDKPFQTTFAFHLAGIIPISGQSLDYKLHHPDCMMPVSQNYTLIEHSIYECAMAGCETIWLICNDDIAPVIRHTVGDYVYDPVYVSRKSKYSSLEKIRIPIFYVPVSAKDRDKRDCLSWSVIHGSLTSLKVSSQISKWVSPSKYYVSFPYGVFPVKELRPHRKLISSSKNFYVTHKGNSPENDYFTSFTFGKDEFIKYRANIRKKGTGMYTTEEVDERGIPRSRLPVEARFSARFFSLSDVFTDLDISDANSFEPTEFHNVSNWEQYCQFISTHDKEKYKRPPKSILAYREDNPIGTDIED